MAQLYPLSSSLLIPRTRKRPPQSGFVQTGFGDMCCSTNSRIPWCPSLWDRMLSAC